MYNDEKLSDLKTKVETWNKKYDPNIKFEGIPIDVFLNIEKYDLFIDQSNGNKFVKVKGLSDNSSLQDLFEQLKKDYKEQYENKFECIRLAIQLEDDTVQIQLTNKD